MNTNYCTNYQGNSFKGILHVDGVKLQESKLKTVKTLFEKASEGLPDIFIEGFSINGDEGRFCHYTNIVSREHQSFFYAKTSKFKKLFNDMTPEALTRTFVKIAKINQLEEEIYGYKIKLARVNNKLRDAERHVLSKQFQALAENFKRKIETLRTIIDKKQEQLNKIHIIRDFEQG